jgi:hypothetical protein
MKAFLFFLFFSGIIFAQGDNITLNTEAFSELKVYDGLSVTMTKGTDNTVVVSGEDPKNVSIVNEEGVLKIKMKFKKMFSGYRTFISLNYSSPFNILDANEEASIKVDNLIEQEKISLKVQEGAQIEASLKVDQLIVKTVTGSQITTKGYAKIQDVSINTGGIYKGQSLKTSFTTIGVNAGGIASIFATDYVGATVKAGGKIKVFGDPKKMDEKTFFGGSIERVKQ